MEHALSSGTKVVYRLESTEHENISTIEHVEEDRGDPLYLLQNGDCIKDRNIIAITS